MEAAKETLGLAEKSGDRSIKIMGLIMLGMTGLATMLHAGHAIYRDLFAGKARKDQGPSYPATPKARPESPAIDEAPHQGAEQSWVRKARLTEREPAGEQARPAYRDRHGHAHQR
jgi:hypothetical protein